jgi:hypothetical protein
VTNKALDGKYAAFGRLDDMDSLQLANTLTTDDEILSITIIDMGAAPAATQTSTPDLKAAASATPTSTPTATSTP